MLRSGICFLVFAVVWKRYQYYSVWSCILGYLLPNDFEVTSHPKHRQYPRCLETSETKCPLRQKNGYQIWKFHVWDTQGGMFWTPLESCSYLNAAVWETVAYTANRGSCLPHAESIQVVAMLGNKIGLPPAAPVHSRSASIKTKFGTITLLRHNAAEVIDSGFVRSIPYTVR